MRGGELRKYRIAKFRYNEPKERPKPLTEYKIQGILGKGSFGMVLLVSHTEESPPTLRHQPGYQDNQADTSSRMPKRKSVSKDAQLYAMKAIRKAEMLRNCQDGHIRAERDFLVASTKQRSKWVVPLLASFQDRDHLYLVMDCMIGGDFLALLVREDVLPEACAR